MNPMTAFGAGIGPWGALSARSGLGFRAVTVARVIPAGLPGVLPPPYSVYVAEDGRALACFDDGRPCVVHPSFAELCRMHGVEAKEALAA
jgi:hypothetical protein